jgi:predicted SnoaL-like aldol condensation-catalyzing enzyme
MVTLASAKPQSGLADPSDVGGGAHARMTDQLEHNKQQVTAFYDLMFNQCRPAEAIERYVGDVYIQHNPAMADGKQSFIALFRADGPGVPGKHVAFKRVVAEGDYVVLHCYHNDNAMF